MRFRNKLLSISLVSILLTGCEMTPENWAALNSTLEDMNRQGGIYGGPATTSLPSNNSQIYSNTNQSSSSDEAYQSSNSSSQNSTGFGDDSYFESYSTNIHTDSRWQSSEFMANSMAKTRASLAMRESCDNKGYQTFYGEADRNTRAATLETLTIRIETDDSTGRRRYLGLADANAWCARPKR